MRLIDRIQNFKGDAIIHHENIYSYEELLIKSREYLKELYKRNLNDSTCVIYSNYSFYSIALLIAFESINCVVVPIITSIKTDFNKKLNASKANVVIKIGNFGDLEIREIHKSRNAFVDSESKIMLFSSGTSGEPKGMLQNLNSLVNSIPISRRQKNLKFIILLMFDHIGGLNTLLSCLLKGSCIVIHDNMNPIEVMRCISKHQVQVLPTTPTFLNLLSMSEDFDPSLLASLRLITYGTERMSDSLLIKLNSLIPNAKFIQTFGTSETGILQTESKSSNSSFFKIKDSSQYKIIDGELFLRTNTTVEGYINKESFPVEEGWYRTGDLVELDGQGFFRIVGRRSDVINVGGLKVLPKEIEDVINNIKDVIDSKVYSEKNAIVGNVVCAEVVTKIQDKEGLEFLKNEINKHCRRNLEKYKVPVRINFSELKITERGKRK